MITKSTDLLARLLAQENISVAHARARTASFDIKSRILTLPNWKDMTPEILDLMVFHEVGHALWTTQEYLDFLVTDGNKKYKDVMNVIEDSRIERMIKEQFPGIRKMFTEGYIQLQQKDFFGVPSSMYNSMAFIDRINLYYKIGISSGIKFTNPTEKQFIDRINNIKSVKDVIDVSVEIYEYSKEEKETKTTEHHDFMQEIAEEDKAENQDDSFEDDSEEDEGGYGSVDEDEQGSTDEVELQEKEGEESDELTTKTSTGTISEEEQQEQIESKTQRSLHTMLEDSADESTSYSYWKYGELLYDPFVPHKHVIEKVRHNEALYLDLEISYEEVKSFMTETSAVVNYLAKEFELKKSADLYRRTREAKSGDIDTKKLYAYKLKDDIFRKINIVPTGKNHGMIMLLDWSGSMTDCMKDTLRQVINLSMFCRKVQIPFQVLAFTDRVASNGHKEWIETQRQNIVDREERYDTDKLEIHRFSLIELFSDKMNAKDFKEMARICLNGRIYSTYPMYGTPLVEATAYMIDYIKTFQETRNIQKMTFLTLTDGEGTTITQKLGAFDFENNQRITKKHFLVGKTSKKSFTYGNTFNVQMKATLELLKEETNATVLGFYVGRPSWRNLGSFIDANMIISGNHMERRQILNVMTENLKKEIRDNKYAAIKDTGRDMLFYVPMASTKIVNEELVVDGTKSSRALAGILSRHINKQKTSRVLLSHFIDYIA